MYPIWKIQRGPHLVLGLTILLLATIAVLTLSGAPTVNAATTAVTYPLIRLQPIASGLSNPIDVVDPKDGTNRLFVIERGGFIRIIQNGVLLDTPFLNIGGKVANCSECGLLGLAFPPDFAQSAIFYVNYTSNTNLVGPDTGDADAVNDTVIARVHVSSDPNIADVSSELAILTINQPAGNHNGGHILFGPDDHLYIGMGDGGGGGDQFQNAQDPASLHGKILRIAVGPTGTYTIPDDNPFIDTPDYRDEIWAEGLRNPWRFNFDPTSGDLYIADVGQGTFEEINHVAAADIGNGGMNFGWPIMEGSACYPPTGAQNCDRTGLTLPVAAYDHSQGDCSVTGGYVYHSPMPFQTPIYLYADFCTGRVWGLQRDGDEWVSQLIARYSFNITSFGEDRNGNIYLVDYSGTVNQISCPGFAQYLPSIDSPFGRQQTIPAPSTQDIKMSHSQ